MIYVDGEDGVTSAGIGIEILLCGCFILESEVDDLNGFLEGVDLCEKESLNVGIAVVFEFEFVGGEQILNVVEVELHE